MDEQTVVTVEDFNPDIDTDLIPPDNHHQQPASAHDPDYEPELPDVPELTE